MSNKRRRAPSYFAALFFVLFLSGCASTATNMQMVPPDKITVAPEKGKSMVVFMRPSDVSGAAQSSLFEIKKDTPSLIGIIEAREKISYQLEPGEHLFMVVGKNTDFMSAELQANKTYYAHIMPKMGRWVGRFSLYPIPLNQLYSARLNERLESCKWVEKTAAANDWVNSNMADLQSKYKKHYAEWMKKDSSAKPKLLLQDGK